MAWKRGSARLTRVLSVSSDDSLYSLGELLSSPKVSFALPPLLLPFKPTHSQRNTTTPPLSIRSRGKAFGNLNKSVAVRLDAREDLNRSGVGRSNGAIRERRGEGEPQEVLRSVEE